MCTINKNAHTKKVWKLDLRVIYKISKPTTIELGVVGVRVGPLNTFVNHSSYMP